jgi:hypothetical protein
MKKIVQIFMTLAIFFMGLGSFAAGGFLNPNLDIHEVRASHVLVKTRKEAPSVNE